MRSAKISLYEKVLNFIEGREFESYKFMGAHPCKEDGKDGYRFMVWAPKCKSVSVVGDFNNWCGRSHKMRKVEDSGVWELFIDGIKEGEIYKYEITQCDGKKVLKADPYSFYSEKRPNNASIAQGKSIYRWGDGRWIGRRRKTSYLDEAMNIYEVHLGSFLRKDNNEFLNYREIGQALIKYVEEMGYTHIEIMPITEYPLDDSWGYQTTGYFSPTSRYGTRDDLKYFIDRCHRKGIGVILDWVPGHFCKDSHGLFMFDGSHQYEYDDFMMYDNPGWGTANFNLGKNEVRNFLISSAIYWIKEFHFDGLRIDAVSNMVYLDFCKPQGKWISSEKGDNINYEAKEFLRTLNEEIHNLNEGIITIAEESTAMAYVTSSDNEGGLGFDLKWNMGWMNDTLSYIELDSIYRKYHHNKMNFSMMYNYNEKFILPISHDEVVHGKRSLVNKMWGDDWKKYAGLRAYISFMMGHPGKKLMFMGTEFAQFVEWREWEELQWKVIDEFEIHKKTSNFFKDLNRLYLENKALWELDYDEKGFKWIDADNSNQGVFSFIRRGVRKKDSLIFICNFTPEVYYDFQIGVMEDLEYFEVLNSDSLEYGGAGNILGEVYLKPKEETFKEFKYSIRVKVPPLGALILKAK